MAYKKAQELEAIKISSLRVRWQLFEAPLVPCLVGN